MLLDTHVWIWAATADGRLGRKTRRRLDRMMRTASGDRLFVSTASILEIAALHTAGRLQFDRPVERWINESLYAAHLRVLDLTRTIALDAGLVPAAALADPIDRCLVATAREHDLPLVTCDRRILEYAKRTGLVRTVDGSS